MQKRGYIPRELREEQPDRCELCPLLGKLPKDERRGGERKGYCCLGVLEADVDEDGSQCVVFPRLTSKGIRCSAEGTRASGHLLHRPCDGLWQAWVTLPGSLFPMLAETYLKYRLPYEHEQQLRNYPTFGFRVRRPKKKKIKNESEDGKKKDSACLRAGAEEDDQKPNG